MSDLPCCARYFDHHLLLLLLGVLSWSDKQVHRLWHGLGRHGLVRFDLASDRCVPGRWNFERRPLGESSDCSPAYTTFVIYATLFFVASLSSGEHLGSEVSSPGPSSSWLNGLVSGPVRIGNGGSPSYSPDGKKIIFAQGNGRGESAIGIMDSVGRNAKMVVTQGTNIEPAFSPDGSKITYVRLIDDTRNDWGHFVHWKIVVSNVDGSSTRVVNKTGRDSTPKFTPDGLSVSFFREASLKLSDHLKAKKANNPQPVFTSSLYLLNLQDGKETKLVEFKHSTSACYDPDRRRIAFTRSEENSLQSRVLLYVMNADGTNLRKITTTGNSCHPSFSKDGQWLTFSYNNTIAVADSNGSQVRVLTKQAYEGPYAQHPKFSPDGKHILFEDYHGITKGVSDICRISLVP